MPVRSCRRQHAQGERFWDLSNATPVISCPKRDHKKKKRKKKKKKKKEKEKEAQQRGRLS